VGKLGEWLVFGLRWRSSGVLGGSSPHGFRFSE
jgi:hypothetical protein